MEYSWINFIVLCLIYFDLYFYFIFLSSDFTLSLHVTREQKGKKEQESDRMPLQPSSQVSFASVLDRILCAGNQYFEKFSFNLRHKKIPLTPCQKCWKLQAIHIA